MGTACLFSSLQSLAHELGFPFMGVAHADCAPHADTFLQWLAQGNHAGMAWMEREPQRRCDPRLVLPDCRSVVVLAHPYASTQKRPAAQGTVAEYAANIDYHHVLEQKLRPLDALLSTHGGTQKCYTDTGPVLERDWAVACGLGWRGKSGLVIHPKLGSKFFISIILTTLDFTPTKPIKSRCGLCTRCVDACPTNAILPSSTIDCNKCISYLTIEHKGDIPTQLHVAIGSNLYGCDACLAACPWNSPRKLQKDTALTHSQPELQLSTALSTLSLQDILELTPEQFLHHFSLSPLLRLKLPRLHRNAKIVCKNLGP